MTIERLMTGDFIFLSRCGRVLNLPTSGLIAPAAWRAIPRILQGPQAHRIVIAGRKKWVAPYWYSNIFLGSRGDVAATGAAALATSFGIDRAAPLRRRRAHRPHCFRHLPRR